ncbi:MAG: hypothetical protein LBM69_09485, partial [Lachnospiraceae bacterium]|nr:hypothetical protein [Lachnospiraceae bacterium]
AHLPIYMPRRKTNDKLNHIETGCFAINDQRGIVLTNLAVADHEKQKYHYWAVSHPDYDFQAYEIGLGLKGIFLALKTGDSTLGVVSKATKSVNYKSKYTIYVESSTFVPFAVLMALYWDAAQYFYSDASDEYGAFLGFHTEYHHFKSKQQELRNKYDPSFILRIKEMDK